MGAGEGSTIRSTRVKICGITNRADAEAAIKFGADALGLNFYRGSRRYLPIAEAAAWAPSLPLEIDKIAVLVNPTWEEALRIAALPFITSLQLHGSETPEFCRSLANHRIRFSKALPATGKDPFQDVALFGTETFIADSPSDGQFGGTGRRFPWEIARRLVEANPEIRVFLAGGLTPENVRDAIAAVGPFGVDVTSGVEASPGRKDHARMRSFIAAVGRG